MLSVTSLTEFWRQLNSSFHKFHLRFVAKFDLFFFYEQQSWRSLYVSISLSRSAAVLRSSIFITIFNFLRFAQAQLRKTGQITSLSTSQSAVFALCRWSSGRVKCTRCERLLPVKHFYLTCLLFFRRLKITLDSEQPMLKEKRIIPSVWGGIKGFEHFLRG